MIESTESFHTTYLKVVNPSSDKLIKSLYFIAVANAPGIESFDGSAERNGHGIYFHFS